MTFHKIIAHYALVFRMFDMKLGVIWSEVNVTRVINMKSLYLCDTEKRLVSIKRSFGTVRFLDYVCPSVRAWTGLQITWQMCWPHHDNV